MRTHLLTLSVLLCCQPFLWAADKPPTPEEAKKALAKAIDFFHKKVAVEGGYVWQTSGDLKLREGEGKAGTTLVWVQPPGTPTVGEAFLDAYEATKEKAYLDAARDAAGALIRGQMRTGGWGYSIEFDPEKRRQFAYRETDPVMARGSNRATVLDDDTTQSAIRFLVRLDKVLAFKDKKIHDAVVYALDGLIKAQYPNGGWSARWEELPRPGRDKAFPVRQASFPDAWPRTHPQERADCYIINDNLITDVVRTLLEAWAVYKDKRYLEAAKKAGDFLILAQMPDPQPGWAQQYNADMHPCWARKFEPPAITGGEAQGVMDTLMRLYRETQDKKYLEPLPKALAYYKKLLLPDGRLARFYELKTNKPLYFTRDYKLVYTADDLPTHYGFIVSSRLDRIEADYKRLGLGESAKPTPKKGVDKGLANKARAAIDSLDERGAWVEKQALKAHKETPASGVIRSQTFVQNVRTLAQFIRQSEQKP